MKASTWGLTVLLALLLTGASDLVGHTEAAGKPKKSQVKKQSKQTTSNSSKKKLHHKKHHHKKHHHKKKTSSTKGLLQNLETELAMAEKDLKALTGK
jgi:hypothetical protein